MNIFIPLGGDTGEEEKRRHVEFPAVEPATVPTVPVPSEPVPA